MTAPSAQTAKTTPAPLPGGGYILENRWKDARRRLARLEQCYDPGTTRRLDALGVEPGWRCLEVGGGGGSIARWLCQQVEAGGQVVATDIESCFLEELDLPNLEVLRHNLVADPLPEADFDLVHARAVLVHLPARQAVLDKLVAALRPGGWVLLEEPDHYAQAALASGEYAEAWHWAGEAMRSAGVDMTWARHLPELLTRANLVEVGASTEAPLLVGGSPAAEFLQVSYTQLWDQAIVVGAPSGLLERACAALDDSRRWFPGYGIVAAWGRRPVV